MRAIKKNMKDQILTPDRKILHCPICSGEWSGNAGDYWNCPNNYIFTCNKCEVELELVEKQVLVKYI